MSKKEDSLLINTKVKSLISRINTVANKVEGASKFSDLENMDIMKKEVGAIKYIGDVYVNTDISGNNSGYIKITSEAMYFNGRSKVPDNTYKLDLITWTISRSAKVGNEAEGLPQPWSSPENEKILPEPFIASGSPKYFLSSNDTPQVVMVYINGTGGDLFRLYKIY